MEHENDIIGFLQEQEFCPDSDGKESWYDYNTTEKQIRVIEHDEGGGDCWWEIITFTGPRVHESEIRFIGTPNRIVIACLREILASK